MKTDQSRYLEHPAPPPVLAGVLFALLAAVGVEATTSQHGLSNRWDRAHAIAIRAAVQPSVAVSLAQAGGLRLAAGSLVLFILLGRPVAFVARPVPRPTNANTPEDCRPAMLHRARTSVSYHIGGLYGP